MSFIGKLLRKTEPLTPGPGATAPLDERVLADARDAEPEVSDEVPATDLADETRADDPDSTPDVEAQSLPAAEQANDTAWWEEPPPTAAASTSSTATRSSKAEPAESATIAEHPAMIESVPQT